MMKAARRGREFGVGARLLLAFVGISAFAVFAAAAGIWAFREVGSRLDVVETRLPPTVSALELSRSAERIIAAAPALLAATDRGRRDEVSAALVAEVGRLNARLLDLKEHDAELPSLLEFEPIVTSLTDNLASLEGLVARRLETNERIGALRRSVFRINDETQRLLAPWVEVVGSEIAALVEAPEASPIGSGPKEGRLASLIELEQRMRAAQANVFAVAEMLAEASTTDQPRRLRILSFQLGLELRGLDAAADGLDPKLRPMFLDQISKLRAFAQGPNAITEARRQELALVEQGEKLLAETGRLSAQLTEAVDQVGQEAKRDIGEAIRDALSVQRFSTRALVAMVALSLLTSALIAWLYVGRNIVRRLTALSGGMLAIAQGSVRAPVTVDGADEIAAMARAVETFRQNTLERDRLLADKAQAAERLEREIELRTAELARSVEELRALGEVSQAVNSTVDLETVLTTIVAKATQLSGTEAGAIYVYDAAARQFQLRATHGMEEALVAEIRTHRLRLGETALGRAVERGVPVQIPDVQEDASSVVLDAVVRAGYRALLLIPLLGAERIVGALVVRRKLPGEFAKSTVGLLQTFAAQSVLAIQNARLFSELQEKGLKLEAADRYKSQFLASASHDLRQPLHALNLFLAQWRAESDPEERDRLVARIGAAVSSMNELLEALLDMSKLDAGVLQPDWAEFPLEPLLKRIETTFAEAAREKGLRLRVVASTLWVRSDAILLERMLLNLVSNAVRYTSRGGVLVGCRRRGTRLRIDVCDSGCGIPEEEQERIFGEFIQLSSANPDRRGGLGLGLSIVQRLGRILAHPIEVSSDVGRGSRFSVTVAVAESRRDAAEPSAARATIADTARGKLVVVIDDDALALDGLGGILRSWGCRVVAAESGEAARANLAAQRLRPDLIISDYRLADGKTGIQAIEQLRNEFGPGVPAFLVTGDTAPQRLREASASGYHLLHKPMTAMRLRAMLTQFLTPRGAPDDTRPGVRRRPIRRPAAARDQAPRPQ